jgi:hypothetical protein
MSEQLQREDLDSMSIDEILQANREGRLEELKQAPSAVQQPVMPPVEADEPPGYAPIFKD